MQTGEENRYRQAVRQAIEAADGPIEHILESLSNQMKIQAGKMQFEKAQTIKNRIDQMGRLKVRSYRWTQRMDKLKILHISQSSSKVSFENLRQKNTVFSGYLISLTGLRRLQTSHSPLSQLFWTGYINFKVLTGWLVRVCRSIWDWFLYFCTKAVRRDSGWILAKNL